MTNAVSGMYNGFDWYGRTLEVREVSLHLWGLPCLTDSQYYRIGMLAFLAPVLTVVVFAVAFAASVVVPVVVCAAVADSVADTAAAQPPVGTSPVKTCTLTTQALTKLAQRTAEASVEVVQPMPAMMQSLASRLWSAMSVFLCLISDVA